VAFLVHDLPTTPVFVRKEFLYDHQKGHGELTPGYWISVKSIRSRALYFETLLTDYGALYDKLPISAFVWKEDYTDELPLDHLQLWDCFDYHLTVIRKPILSRCKFFAKNKKLYSGDYLFTIDNCHADNNLTNCCVSELDQEHKSFNVIKLDNGQFAIQPNNRVLFQDASLIPSDLGVPDFKVCTQNYQVENGDKWSVGHTDDWQYKAKEE
jgi:hypothetical protein